MSKLKKSTTAPRVDLTNFFVVNFLTVVNEPDLLRAQKNKNDLRLPSLVKK